MACVKPGMLNPEFHIDVQNDRQDDMQHQSPDYVQLSTAAAITLGLERGRMYRCECTHCLNLLLTYPEGCRANCSYCGLARHREEARDYAERNFIRVDWPTVNYAQIIDKVKQGGDQGQFERMCISMITHPRSNRDTVVVLEEWMRNITTVPVSILSNPTTMEYELLVELRDKGADIFTVALDASTPSLFERTRGRTVNSPHRWDHYWQVIHWAAEIFGPEKFGVHLISGMGESELEILQVVQGVRDLGGHSHMFAFFPEQGSLMEDWPAVPQAQWRRVQFARFLIDYRNVHIEHMRFDPAGKLIDFGLPQYEVEEILNTGAPFRTSGCPGKTDPEISACNRPFGDSPPSDIRSYPFAPDQGDLELISSQLGFTRK